MEKNLQILGIRKTVGLRIRQTPGNLSLLEIPGVMKKNNPNTTYSKGNPSKITIHWHQVWSPQNVSHEKWSLQWLWLTDSMPLGLFDGRFGLNKNLGGYIRPFYGKQKKSCKKKVILLIAKKGWPDMSKNICVYIYIYVSCKYDNVGYVIQLMDTNAQYVDYDSNELTSVFTNPTVSYRCCSTKILQHKL